jgi:hypothetical protein
MTTRWINADDSLIRMGSSWSDLPPVRPWRGDVPRYQVTVQMPEGALALDIEADDIEDAEAMAAERAAEDLAPHGISAADVLILDSQPVMHHSQR